MKMLNLTRLIALSIALTLPLAAGAKMFKWVDENGVVHFGDRIPAKYANKESERLNQQGVTVETRERTKTQAELDAEAAVAAQQQKEADYDRFLLTTYDSDRDIIAQRDNHLATLDGQIILAEKAKVENETGLSSLRNREAELLNAGKPVPPTIIAQILQFEGDLAQRTAALKRLRINRNEIAAKFASDLTRYRSLKGLAPTADSQ